MKKNTSRYNGRNVFGERCIAKFATLEKGTALKQFMEILDDLDAHAGMCIEYTFNLSKDFSPEEAAELHAQLDRVSALHAMSKNREFIRQDIFGTPRLAF